MTTTTPKPRAGEHTKGPWRVVGDAVIQRANGQMIGRVERDSWQTDAEAEANARRIVACVNALEGVSLEAIENGGRSGSVMQALGIERDRAKVLLEATQRQYIEAKTERDSLAAQNRELREALASIDQLMMSMPLTSKIEHQVHGIAHRALTKARPAS